MATVRRYCFRGSGPTVLSLPTVGRRVGSVGTRNFGFVTGVGAVLVVSATSSFKLASMLSAVSLSTSVKRSARKESSPFASCSRAGASVSVPSLLYSPSNVRSKEKVRGTLLTLSGVYYPVVSGDALNPDPSARLQHLHPVLKRMRLRIRRRVTCMHSLWTWSYVW